MNLGNFDAKVLQKLNLFLKDTPIAPITDYHSVDAELFYFVTGVHTGHNVTDEGFDPSQPVDDEDDMVDVVYEQYANMKPIAEWEALSKEILFTGEIYTLVAPKSYYVGGKSVSTPDITTRAYKSDTKVSVVDILRVISYVAFDPMIEDTDHAGIIEKIKIDKEEKVPTLIVEFKHH